MSPHIYHWVIGRDEASLSPITLSPTVPGSACRSLYRCGSCCVDVGSTVTATISLTRYQCTDGSGSPPTGSQTITATGTSTFIAPSSYPTLIRQFGDYSLDLQDASIVITSTGDYSATNDGTYVSNMELELQGCDEPEVVRLTPDGVATAGTFTITVNGVETSAIAYDATNDQIRSAILAVQPTYKIEITDGPIATNYIEIWTWTPGGDLASTFYSADPSLLTGVSDIDVSTRNNGAQFSYTRWRCTIRESGGSKQISATIDDYDPGFGTDVAKVTYQSVDYTMQTYQASCFGCSGLHTFPRCEGATQQAAFEAVLIV